MSPFHSSPPTLVAVGDLVTIRRTLVHRHRTSPRAAALVAALAAVLVLAGCAPGTPAEHPGGRVPAGTEVRTIEVDGVERAYRLHIPQDLGGDPALVVMLHGGFGSARQAEAAYGWDEQSEAHGFVVAFPDGENRAWNAGDCCGQPAASAVDDVGSVASLVAELQGEFDIASGRTFATGMSNGAMLTYRLACETGLFAAVAPVAGTILTECEHPHPVSLLHIHGTQDTRVRMDGQPGEGRAHVDGLPVADAVAIFSAAEGCPEPVVTTEGVVTTSASACPGGRAVTLVTIAGAGHQWPGGGAPEPEATDPPSTAFDATAEIWQFFDAA